MYIEEVSIEGFKSYAQRTVVSNFDPKFNAITGLNGSGKSNILDSICFVLGITNLQHVRASSLQELVYKQGQAGINKATVSIVFNNNDKDGSPLGYEECKQITVTRQIVIGGRNKYLINGHVAQPSRVQNLFHSVQLNVNNPHFLIMQGRITKVLNMKPPEILSMLEEAAGTRMYEMKKEGALKTLEKKQTKVDEIDTVLSEEILPALEKLRKERAQYQQWAQGNADLDQLKRFVTAYEYSEADKLKNDAKGGVDKMHQEIAQLEDLVKQLDQEIQVKVSAIAELRAEKEKQMGSAMKKLVDAVDQLSKDLVKETSVWSNKKDSLQAERAAAEQLEKSLVELEAALAEKDAATAAAAEEVEAARKAADEASTILSDAETEYQGVQAGKSGAPGEDKSLAEKLSEAKAAAVEASTEAKQASLKIKHLQKELVVKRKLLMTKQKEATSLQKELESRQSEVDSCQQALQGLAFDEERMGHLQETKKIKTLSVKDLRSKIGELEASLNLGFSYNDPVRGFDRSRVKGLVAKLMKVKDLSAATALEVIAGGKMFNVVVDTEQTGKLILEKGGLKKRVTIIPLNKIEGRTIPQRVQAKAAQLVGAENVTTALSLVQYEPELAPAMGFVFGNHFVCKDSATAQKVAFHPDIMTPCVTLEGDLFSPSGLITGGSRRGGGSILSRVHLLAEMEATLLADEAVLQATLKELEGLAGTEKQHRQLKGQLELKSHQLSLLQDRIQQSEHHQLSQEVAGMEGELEAATEASSHAEERQKTCAETVASLAKAIEDYGKEREARLKAAEAKIKDAKQRLARATKDLKAKESGRERLALDREASVKEKDALQEQMAAAQSQVAKLEEVVTELERQVAAKNAEYQGAEEVLQEKRRRMQECDKELDGLARAQSQMKERIASSTVEIKKLSHKTKQMEAEALGAAKFVDDILKRCGWIHTEKQFFGQRGTDYDFSSRNPAEAKAQLKAKEAEQSSVEKRINKKVMSMFEKAEQEYNELLAKKARVQNDKEKIQKVIHELDETKKKALKKTWENVTRDFGSIFSTLLPGTMARLEPPEGEDFMAGLEVKVAFGQVWKQSLSELSGGQRSLLALSLILALLLYKPAPLYILDEVDAALDLSHTQNIGRMIKSHFPHSQFVVVSLKEGMFSNANVIFRTKFVDGISAVTRTVPAVAQAAHGGDRGARGGKGLPTPARRREERENVDPNVHSP